MVFYNQLLDACELNEGDREKTAEYFASAYRNQYVFRNSDDAFRKDFPKTFNKFHNPLEIGSLFSACGFELVDIVYLNMHPMPPAVMEQIGQREMLAVQMERRLSRSWQANFLASSFLVCARKLPPDPLS